MLQSTPASPSSQTSSQYIRLNEHYNTIWNLDKKNQNTEKDISQTLITKILLATLGCVPAYDSNFIDGIKIANNGKPGAITIQGYQPENDKSIKKLAAFYACYDKCFKNTLKAFKNPENLYLPYPSAKLLDVGFLTLGKNKPELIP